MIDSARLAAELKALALAPFRIDGHDARDALQALAEAALPGVIRPSEQHALLGVPCRVLAVAHDRLLLRAAIRPELLAPAWQSAVAAFPQGQHILRFTAHALRPADEDNARPHPADGVRATGARLCCDYPADVWRVHRRSLFRVAPPEAPPLRLHAHAPRGAGPWLGVVIDLGIGGLAFEVVMNHVPCDVDAILAACHLADGTYSSPPFDLRVRSVHPGAIPGHWRIGAALLNPPRAVISSLQLATYRFEIAQRRRR